ncbi:YidH family protein [Pseudoxanthomonas sp. UTMC 1351]|uniref:YidH family protein n=1 Tax=Pseudoxanthomonas sp. UTMC 1351 TaxID=2695853 RepID=UPI0034CD1646
MNTSEPSNPDLPQDLAQSIEGKDSGTASTLLSTHRTKLSIRRTGLSDLRSHLANERTHLAYLRTSISLIGFGITINRFAIFLQEKHVLSGTQHRPLLRDTENAGAGMVIVGLALVAWSLYRYWHVNHDIEQGVFRPLHRAVISVTVLLLLGGGATAAWLFLQ